MHVPVRGMRIVNSAARRRDNDNDAVNGAGIKDGPAIAGRSLGVMVAG